MKYHFTVHTEKNGFWAECRELPGCVSEEKTLELLAESCAEALNLYLEEPEDSTLSFALPDTSLDSNKRLLPVSVDPEIALAVLLRHYRAKTNLTQKQAAEKLGMKNIYSYQRLERKSNPTLNLISRIHAVFPEIGLESLL